MPINKFIKYLAISCVAFAFSTTGALASNTDCKISPRPDGAEILCITTEGDPKVAHRDKKAIAYRTWSQHRRLQAKQFPIQTHTCVWLATSPWADEVIQIPILHDRIEVGFFFKTSTPAFHSHSLCYSTTTKNSINRRTKK